MQTIQLHATPQQDYRLPETVELQVATPLHESETDLDDALAVILHAVRQSKNPHAMDALGSLLAYMERLEKKQGVLTSTDPWVTLANPVTMSL
jgi:hypothetical protein